MSVMLRPPPFWSTILVQLEARVFGTTYPSVRVEAFSTGLVLFVRACVALSVLFSSRADRILENKWRIYSYAL